MTYATMNLNAQLNGIELTFNEKPSDAIRQSLKDLGFRWSAKLGYWWARQTDERIELAKSLSKSQKKAKTTAKNAKVETKTTAKNTKTAPKQTAKPKTETKKAELPQLKLGELSDKCKFAVLNGDDIVNVKGYTFTATIGRRQLTLGVAKRRGGTWKINELTTGCELTACTSEHRYLALDKLTAEIVDKTCKQLKTKKYKAMAENMENYKAR